MQESKKVVEGATALRSGEIRGAGDMDEAAADPTRHGFDRAQESGQVDGPVSAVNGESAKAAVTRRLQSLPGTGAHGCRVAVGSAPGAHEPDQDLAALSLDPILRISKSIAPLELGCCEDR